MFWRAAEAADPLQQRPALGVGGQRPGLVHRQHRVAGRVGGAEPQRVGGQQAQDGEAGALLLEQLRAGGAGQRQGEVADPQRDDLGVADRGELGRRRRRGRAWRGRRGRAPRSPAPPRPPRRCPSAASRASTSPQLAAPAARGLGDRQTQLGLPLGLDRRRQDRDQEVVGEVLAGLLRADPHRVEQAAVALLAGELDRLDPPVDPGQALEAVIALGVDVDDRPRALQEGLPDRQLETDRLARAEAAGQQAGRRAVLLAGLGEVELDRRARAGQRVADVGTDPRAGVADRVRHHRPELVGQQVLPVLGQRKASSPAARRGRGGAARRAGRCSCTRP